eukprot:TRINITY_DN11435_c0_g2_i2.p1 TRINITY_DN11435_c0_g2~~TRINITY_DN11435_c0_g2_i2.p1  ORF type:complete len:386 (-),score=34.61 TRINITY_DN11435_c0_g2_i2:116-1273(-)
MALIIQAPGTALFTGFYLLFAFGFWYETKEIKGFGLSPEQILVTLGIIKDEQHNFLEYHIWRTSCTFVLRSCLMFGYIILYLYVGTYIDGHYDSLTECLDDNSELYYLIAFAALFIGAAFTMSWQSLQDNYSGHSIVETLEHYAQQASMESLMADINAEYRRVDKVCVELNSLTHLIITDNWIILLGVQAEDFRICHQSDASLTILDSDSHYLSPEGEAGGSQYLRIQVTNRKPDIPDFTFRINSLEYQNVQSKLDTQIQNLKNINITKSVSDRFVDVFKAEVEKNPRVTVNDDLEACIGCMVNQADVKLVRTCGSTGEGSNSCVNCYCRPMWCITCMAKWFASRQNQKEPETWLGSRCPCPTCRSKFCVLDVAMISPEAPEVQS